MPHTLNAIYLSFLIVYRSLSKSFTFEYKREFIGSFVGTCGGSFLKKALYVRQLKDNVHLNFESEYDRDNFKFCV